MWIVFLAALLCLTMLFVSCDSKDNTDDKETTDPFDTSDTEDTTPTEPDEKTPAPESVDYASLIKKWTNYISYRTPTDEDALPTGLDKFYDSDSREWFGDTHGDLWLRTETVLDDKNDPDSDYYYVYEVYNLKTGVKVFDEQSSKLPVMFDESSSTYEVKMLGQGEIFMAIEAYSTYDATLEENVTTYYVNFYDANGKALTTEMEFDNDYDARWGCYDVAYNGYDSFITIGDKTYVCRDGEIFTVFDRLEKRGLPEITLNYAGMYYSIGEDMIWVFDENYDELVSYSYGYGAWDDTEPYILANGDILLQKVVYDAEEGTKGAIYDPYYDEYYCIEQVLINPAKGTVTDLDVTFWIDDMITPATDDREIAVSADCQIAAVWKIAADSTIANELSYLALDSAMTVKEELPAILKNQYGLLGAIDANTFCIKTTVNWDCDETYTINANNGEIALLSIDSNDYDYYTEIDGGFVYNDILYSNTNQELVDLRYVGRYQIINEDVIEIYEDSNVNSFKILHIVDGTAVYSNEIRYEYAEWMMDDAFFVVRTNDVLSGKSVYVLYNRFGEEILRGDSFDEHWIGNDLGIERVVYDSMGEAQYSYYIVK